MYDIAFNFREFDKEVRRPACGGVGWAPAGSACGLACMHCGATPAACPSPLLPPPPQVAHLLAMHKKHCGGGPLAHFLEVACGPARHAALIAKSAGAAATGLDLSPGMLKYAQQQVEAAGVGDKLRFVQADMAQGA